MDSPVVQNKSAARQDFLLESAGQGRLDILKEMVESQGTDILNFKGSFGENCAVVQSNLFSQGVSKARIKNVKSNEGVSLCLCACVHLFVRAYSSDGLL